MSYTLVSSFVLQEYNPEKIQDYMNRFAYIKNLQIPTIVFLDKRLHMEETEYLKVVYTSIEDTWIYGFYASNDAILPSGRNTKKDTKMYMFIQNSKVEWVAKASEINPFNTDYFVWIDFGLSHVIQNKAHFQILKHLDLTEDICIASITSDLSEVLDRICWRFAGGIFYCKTTHCSLFFAMTQYVVQTIYPRLTWEVNIWAYIEKQQFMKFSTYPCDHNDTLLTNLRSKICSNPEAKD